MLAAALAMVMLGTGAQAGTDQEVTLANGSLHGALRLADTPKDGPAILMIAGSGPTDRDSNSTVPGVKPATFKLLADGLAAQGITSLRYDKRGIAASAAAMTKEDDIRFPVYVDDAVAWAEFLKTQPHVTCVVIFGHSEGALIAAMAAQKTKVCGVISASGAGYPADEVLMRQLKDRGTPEHALTKIAAIVGQLKAGKTVTDVPPGLAAMFRPSIQPYLISWFPIDPAKELGVVTAPILILQGTTDIQVSQDDAQRLAKGAPKARLVLLDGVNHVLKPAPADPAANIATYADPALPLAPKILPSILGFLKTCHE